jgi:predicted transcriptional regulator
MSQAVGGYALTVVAEGEVRNARGELVETVTGTETVTVSVEELRSFTDDQLRAAGLDEATIAHIRSDIP